MGNTPLARLLAASPRGTALEIARKAGVSAGCVYDFASGRRRGRAVNEDGTKAAAARVAEAAGMTIAQLYGLEPYDPPAAPAATSNG